MSDLGPIIGFFILLIFLVVVTQGGEKPLFNADMFSTSTPSATPVEPREEHLSSVDPALGVETRLTNGEIEDRLVDLYDDLGRAREAARDVRLMSPASPFQGKVELGMGGARETRWGQEYLTLRADSYLTSGVDVTGWYLESYVTGERATIPQGDRVLESVDRPVLEHIVLLPGEDAYVITGRPPVDVSFHENECTGYLRNEEDFSPYLSSSCPYPSNELLRYTPVSITDDKCYDFVETIGSCAIIDKDDLADMLDARELKLTSACRHFITDELTYERCVARHQNEPRFDDVGTWYIYLSRTRNLWREEREIVRLFDTNGKVVDVIEY